MSLGEFSVEQEDQAATIHLRGEFDLSNVREIEAAAFELVEAGVRELCLDLYEVSFVDSSMLNLLVNLRKRLRARGGAFRVEPNLQITKLLELTGLGELFDLVDSPPGGPAAEVSGPDTFRTPD